MAKAKKKVEAPVNNILVEKPKHRPEFADRRVELAFEFKELVTKYTDMLNEADALGLDVFMQTRRDDTGRFIAHINVGMRLLK